MCELLQTIEKVNTLQNGKFFKNTDTWMYPRLAYFNMKTNKQKVDFQT